MRTDNGKQLILCLLSLTFLAKCWSLCPCDDPRWCKTIQGPPIQVGKEVFGFYAAFKHPNPKGLDMNWTHVTTVAWASQDEIMCLAHQHGARAVIGAPPIQNLTLLADPKRRSTWIQAAVNVVMKGYRDGIVFDYESPLDEGSVEGEIYAQLIAETRIVLHQIDPSFQVSTCVPWSPHNIDGRAYPFQKLADASDALYVMDYDTRSQVYDTCIAGANAPLPGMISGITEWLNLGVAPEKLILGVPWYGYRYPCLPGTPEDAIFCPIESVPFRGVNCSDAAGNQRAHSDMIQIIGATAAQVHRDENTQSLYFNTVESDPNHPKSTVFQYWMEDPVLLRKKFGWARSMGLAGVGPYVFNNLDPETQPEESQAMWSSLDSFFISMSASTSTPFSMDSEGRVDYI
eukprot:Nitzschia sp. Nitz4//scaffold52_size167869//69679//70881//NITZ4_002274-RA/size167869-processed-gene-0.162-mRNA-1//-1//CDS//3329554029//4576//frame0